VAYLFCANPSFFWLDSSELVAASWSLGVAHPPGHPLAVLIGRLFCYLPFGTIAFRVTLASAFLAALSSGLVAALTQEWLKDLHKGEQGWPPRPWLSSLAAMVAGLTAGLSYTVFFQAVRAEVYALNVALIAACALLVLRWRARRDARFILSAAFIAGLGLCNHHLLLLLAALPALVFVIIVAKKRQLLGKRGWVILLSFVLLGLAPFAHLPLRAQNHPQVNWGAPTTVERFAWVVSARAFQQSVERAGKESLTHRAGGAVFAVFTGLTFFGGLLALAGFYFALRRRESRAPGALLGGVVLFNLVGPLLVGFDPFNPDAHGYLAVAVALLAPGIGVSIYVLAQVLAKQRPAFALVALIALALPAHQLWQSWGQVNLRRHFAAEETGRALLHRPPRSVIFTAYYQSIFQAWALQTSAGLRPDITVVHLTFLLQPGYVESMSQRHPELAGLLYRAKKARRLVLADLAQLATERPVYLEPDEMVPPNVRRRLQPAGLLLRFGPPAATDTRRHWERLTSWQNALEGHHDNETRRAALWAHYRLAAWSCGSGHHSLGWRHLAQAMALAPHARALEALARRCGP